MKMQKLFFASMLTCLFGQVLLAQLSSVINWYHAEEKDWVTIAGEQDMSGSGYIQPVLVYKCSTTQSPGMIAIYRWYHPTERDWVTLPETYATDASLISWGYQHKSFLFYAYPDERGGTIRVNLWYHPGEKDYVSLPIDYGSDQALIQGGYQKQSNGFFYAYPKTDKLNLNLVGSKVRIATNTVPQIKGTKLQVFLQCGSDDLRAYNKAYLTVNFTNGLASREYLLQQGLRQNQPSNLTIDLDEEIDWNNVRSISIRHDGTPRSNSNPLSLSFDTYDNWDLMALRITLIKQDGSAKNIYNNLSNTNGGDQVPLRFTGDKRIGEFMKQP